MTGVIKSNVASTPDTSQFNPQLPQRSLPEKSMRICRALKPASMIHPGLTTRNCAGCGPAKKEKKDCGSQQKELAAKLCNAVQNQFSEVRNNML